ncbi:hypothetical protein, partial [Salmonella enterica]|uniref:hypothetical protein n=2 Tax=Salmonella enterica TaxID=28901 RepID=UPI001A9C6399
KHFLRPIVMTGNDPSQHNFSSIELQSCMSACFFGRQHTMTTIIFYSKKFALFLKLLTAFIESGPLKG